MARQDGQPKKQPASLTRSVVRDAVGSALMHPDSPIQVAHVEPQDEDVTVVTLENGQKFAVVVAEV